ncbi:hypothetical protein LF1_00060 [Rubripirellula obstinata]|uniref:Uncharacterized protein n=1 Tax=Rubripirellula obstinata TaxID=406547 RepID=A0A5B1CCS5_9BACT|nr:hypothetical protein LF1_00060 [Rubripirellula obstinata]
MIVTQGDEVRADGPDRNGVLRITIACTGVAAARFPLCLHVKSRHLGDAYRYPYWVHSPNMNPYAAPNNGTSSAGQDAATSFIRQCPVCYAKVNHVALVWPTFRCKRCSNRLVIGGSWQSRLLSFVTAAALIAGSIAAPFLGLSSDVYLLASILLFALAYTLWLQLFGRPRLKSWLGHASSHTLHSTRRSYLRSLRNRG